MNITAELKTKTLAAIKQSRKNFTGSDARHATFLDVNPAQYSQITNGNMFQVLSDDKWISIARKLGVNMSDKADWNTAKTPVFAAITAILNKCQKDTISATICDNADIGKTHAAKEYVKSNLNAVYVDCSQSKSKRDLVKAIAKQFGINHNSRYKDVYADLVFYLATIKNPLVILDEAGDLDGPAELEIKALWNATEKACGWVRMGADGLQAKINRGIANKTVGYVETHSRYGDRFQRVTPQGGKEAADFIKTQAALIIRANTKPGVDVAKLMAKTGGSLRRINTELSKL